MKNFLLSFVLATIFTPSWGQNVHLPQPLEFKKALKKGTRQLDGRPGADYWLNHAKYDIKVSFDPEKKQLKGSETIEYVNNSPDSLKKIVVATYQDILAKETKRDWYFPLEKLNNGVEISRFLINGEPVDMGDRKKHQKKGTNHVVTLQKPLLPKSKVSLEIDWEYTMVETFNVRGGEYSGERFFMNYFYPKIPVYDDVDGWDFGSYTGFTEMYSDFSSYRLEVTVPDEYKVWATGELKNAKDLLSKKIFKRYKKAHESETVVRIISPDDLDDTNLIKGTGEKTWIFESENVPDVAFALGKRILWDGLSFMRNKETGEKLFLDAAYNSDANDFYEVAEISKATIIDMMENSIRWPFPYPQYTVFQGSGGMEYPMMCNNGSQKKKRRTVGLAYHEIAHTYFPFFMGTNERKYAWMDEGWANMFPTDYQNKHFDGYYTPRTQEYYLRNAGSEQEMPIMTITYLNPNYQWYRQATYSKPQFSYTELRKYLGEDLFYKCLKEYMSRWNGKHPIPQDFFNTFNNVSGKNLNWFWRNWYYDCNYPDIAASVEGKKLILENLGGLFNAFHVKVETEDGKTQELEYSADFWLKGMRQEVSFQDNIVKVEVGGEHKFDVDTKNNSWTAEVK